MQEDCLCKSVKRIAFVIRAGALALVVCAAVGLYWAVRYTIADWLSLDLDASDREHATKLVPEAAVAWLRLADLRTENGLPPTAALRGALTASPQRSDAWIQLGLDAEVRGDFAEAERDLIRAVAVDHDFVPRWTLANYYFRRGDKARVFQWAKKTLSWSNADAIPMFRLCWTISQDSSEILNAAIPDDSDTLTAYLKWLSARDLEAAAPVAARLIDQYPQDSAPSLFAYCDHLIDAERLTTAVALWNAMFAHGILQSGAEQTNELTNGDFHAAPVNAGFDWRMSVPAGMEATAAQPGLNLSFSGSQPDRAHVIDQIVLVQAGASYRLRYDFASSGLEAGSGLRWGVIDVATKTLLPPAISLPTLTPPDFASAHSGHGEITFKVPASETSDPEVIRVALIYERPPGSPPMIGWIRLHKVGLEEITK